MKNRDRQIKSKKFKKKGKFAYLTRLRRPIGIFWVFRAGQVYGISSAMIRPFCFYQNHLQARIVNHSSVGRYKIHLEFCRAVFPRKKVDVAVKVVDDWIISPPRERQSLGLAGVGNAPEGVDGIFHLFV